MARDFPVRFRYLFKHLKIHKALHFLKTEHPKGSTLPFTSREAFDDLFKWDWSKVKVKVVMSIPGTYTGADKMADFGICRIGAVVNDQGWVPRKGEMVKAEYQVGVYPHSTSVVGGGLTRRARHSAHTLSTGMISSISTSAGRLHKRYRAVQNQPNTPISKSSSPP